MIDVSLDEIHIEVSEFALKQIKLILENDFTLEGQSLRLHISGKGCNGFDYSIGFSKPLQDDLLYPLDELKLHIDPFTAYYCKKGKIDYIIDHENDVDGFVFTNENEKNHRGKFFKDKSKTPQFL